MSPKETAAVLDVLLTKRGIVTVEEREDFLNPNYDNGLHDPFLLPDMEKAVERVLAAIQNNERIILYTDYDTDGTPAGVILRDFFKKIGYANFQNYIPHRYYEGYGLNSDAIKKFKEEGATLLITADCGISDIAEVRYAEEEGINVILTDHHLPPQCLEVQPPNIDNLPPAYAVINPKRNDNTYPFDGLCGAGVAFKLVCALIARGKEKKIFEIQDGWEKWLLDMVGIATVCDRVPLTGENRVLARFGLTVLQKSRRAGIREFCRAKKIAQRFLNEDDIGFSIGPYINAASRMDAPIKAFNFLTAETDEEARTVVEELGYLNDQRKGFVAAIIKEVKHRFPPVPNGYVRAGAAREMPRVLVAGNPAWHPGLLGLAANTLTEQYARPVFLWGGGEAAILKGSCRSDGSVHIVELMRRASASDGFGGAKHAGGIFADFGGHEFSGGFSVTREEVHKLSPALEAAYGAIEKKTPHVARVADTVISLDMVDEGFYRELSRLAPFGEGNPKPLFLFENVLVAEKALFGKTQNHLKLMLRGAGGKRIPAIQFFADKNEKAKNVAAGQTISLTAHVERNVFGNKTEVRLRIVEIQDTNIRIGTNDTNGYE
ncbi:MAG: single-stranded-DNA-specific exonuclease RecJ [Parcubacteria group bacterium]|nr:single-stranded-DNA-specific exonuclease RecJ [Parcubacteria group bacterium]